MIISALTLSRKGSEMSRKRVLEAATVAAALGAITSVAWAEPMKLADAQMDQVTAGAWVNAGPLYFSCIPGCEWVPSSTPNLGKTALLH
jgi:hypothetical protein